MTPANWKCGRGKRSTLRGGQFDVETWLVTFEEVLQSGPVLGYSQTRFFGHMEWALTDLPGTEDLIQYNAGQRRDSEVEDTVICTNDLPNLARARSWTRCERIPL